MALSTLVTSSSLVMLLLALAFNIASSSAAPAPNTFTNIILPSPNITDGPAGEIQCYSLPYGAVGIISHLLTYWTFAWVGLGKVPLWPWAALDTWAFDLFLSVATLGTCIPTASLTIYRCRLSWHFILISVWKLVTSVSLACMSIHRCILVRRDAGQTAGGKNPKRLFGRREDGSKPSEKISLRPLLWLLLFLAGTIVGMIGLCSLLWTSFRQDQIVRSLTYGFAAPVILVPILVGIFWYQDSAANDDCGGLKAYLQATRNTFSGTFVAFVAVFGFFSGLYADLVLGAIADNLLGLPSSDFAPLYWIWFVAKRFLLVSF